MTHEPTGVARVKDPTEWFGEIVGRVEDAGDEAHEDITVFLPILDGKMLNQNVTGTIGGDASVNHFDRGLVVAVERGRSRRGKTEFSQNGTEVAGLFGGTDSSIKFSFSRACGSSGLRLTLVRDTTARHDESKAGGGATVTEVIAVGSVKETGQSRTGLKKGEGWEVGRLGGNGIRIRRKRSVRGGAMKVNTPGASATQIFR